MDAEVWERREQLGTQVGWDGEGAAFELRCEGQVESCRKKGPRKGLGGEQNKTLRRKGPMLRGWTAGSVPGSRG